MTQEQMISFVGERINAVEQKQIKPELENKNGILLHFIPENLLSDSNINWENRDHVFIVKRAFRRFLDTESEYTDSGDKITLYTPHGRFGTCFQNGIVEVFTSPIVTESSLDPQLSYVNVDNLYYAISNFLDATKDVHEKLYRSSAPYHVFISLLGVNNTHFSSFDKNYVTKAPLGAKNVRFQSFTLNNLNKRTVVEIMAGIHYGVKSITNWPQMA